VEEFERGLTAVETPDARLVWTAYWFGLLERGVVILETPVGLPPFLALPWNNRLDPGSPSADLLRFPLPRSN
jgi:hypothetical protein